MKLVQVEREKCLNCHRCISVCPVKFCNNGSGSDHVEILPEGCIYCGGVVEACPSGSLLC